MSQDSAQASGVFDNLRLARWLLSQGPTAAAIVSYYDAWKEATSAREKWYKAARPAGDLIVDAIDTLPDFAAAEALSVEATALSVDEGKAEAAALSIDWEKVVAVSQKFLPILIQIALKLRG